MNQNNNITKQPDGTSLKQKDNIHRHGAHVLFVGLVGVIFCALAVVFLVFPRSEYSELEKRDLASFPHPKGLKENPQKYTSDISAWFSDTEPYRDHIMTASMSIRDKIKMSFTSAEETFSYKPAADNTEMLGVPDGSLPEAQGNPLADEMAKVANAGIIVVGKAPNVRTLMTFGGTEKSTKPLLNLINEYRKAFPTINMYAMVIPTSTAYYLPTNAKTATKSQKVPLDWFRQNLDPSVKYIDVYGHLAGHIKEPIYQRTDHHWAPLGAYYAARALAAEAKVPFKDISEFDSHTIHGYVGSMYGYSKDISVKNSPEDFVYYTPKNTNYTTYYTTYKTDKDYKIISVKGPYEGEFFHKYPDGSGAAYCTFMGGDSHNVRVTTDVKNGRRLMIIKDSYGNPLPSYLFNSFEEVHVVDFRYFKKNMKKYVADNKISDIVFAFGIFGACTSGKMEKAKVFLTQPDGVLDTPSADSAASSKKSKDKPDSNKEKSKESKKDKQDEVEAIKTEEA